MITFLYGTAGSGKSTVLASRVCEDLKAGHRVLVLVPEQQALMTERRIADLAQTDKEPVPTAELEILNFKRLSNRIFREYGGLAHHYVGKGACSLIMWQTLFSVAPSLTTYGTLLSSADQTVPMMLDAVKELRNAGITPAMLEQAAADTKDDDPKLSGKLSDLALIVSAYQTLLHSGYDDPDEDIVRAAQILREAPFFAPFHVYIDAFDGFTKPEYDLLSFCFRQARQVTVALCADPDDKREFFFPVLETAQRLKRLCPSEPKTEVLKEHPRYAKESLRFAETAFLSEKENLPTPEDDGALRFLEAHSVYEEARNTALAIAGQIQDGTSRGLRYRDFAVIVRDTGTWEGILDTALEERGIPYHLSRRIDLMTHPLFRFLLNALRIHTDSFRREDVIAYLKTGLSGIPADACDEFAFYLTKWNLHGARISSDVPFTMNPAGFVDTFSPADEAMLERVNETKQALTLPLLKWFDVFVRGKAVVRDITASLYTFLLENRVGERIAAQEGNEGVLLWNVLMDALDELVEAAGNLSVTSEQYSELLTFVIRECDTGILPAAADEVLIGSANLLRTGEVKYVYLLGCCEGQFPAALDQKGLFTETERITLETCGVVLSDDEETRSRQELYWFYKAFCCASEGVTLSFAESDLLGAKQNPSSAFQALQTVCGKPLLSFSEEKQALTRVTDLRSAFREAEKNPNGVLCRALDSLLGEEEKEKLQNRLKAASIPIGAETERLDETTAKEIFGGNLPMTQSRLDSFVLCAFGYQCRYVMKLDECRRASFDSADTGTLIHRILERFVRRITTKDGVDPEITEEDLETIADEITSECVAQIGGQAGETLQSNRIRQLFVRLRRSILVIMRDLLAEFKQSDFRPSFFELPITSSPEKEGVPPLAIPLPDGTKAYIYGIIDRVDVYRKDHDFYLRVVDYKTGKKDFSLHDIALGLNLQMLLYLFSLWQDPDRRLIRALGGGEEDRALPAGVLYYSAKVSSGETIDRNMSRDEVMQVLQGTLKRTGMLISDEEILRAMEKSLSGQYIPVRMKKDGTFSTSMPLETLAGFGQQMQSITDKVKELCNELKGGKADAVPLRDPGRDACQYCSMRPICRRKEGTTFGNES